MENLEKLKFKEKYIENPYDSGNFFGMTKKGFKRFLKYFSMPIPIDLILNPCKNCPKKNNCNQFKN